MYRLYIEIERDGYLQEESTNLLSLKSAEMFEAWLDHYSVEHSRQDNGMIEARIYSMGVSASLLNMFLIHNDKEYKTDDYDLWLVDSHLFEVTNFIETVAGTDMYSPLLNEALSVWNTGIITGVLTVGMSYDEMSSYFKGLYIGHFASKEAALINLLNENEICIDNEIIRHEDDESVLDRILKENNIAEVNGYYFYKRAIS